MSAASDSTTGTTVAMKRNCGMFSWRKFGVSKLGLYAANQQKDDTRYLQNPLEYIVLSMVHQDRIGGFDLNRMKDICVKTFPPLGNLKVC